MHNIVCLSFLICILNSSMFAISIESEEKKNQHKIVFQKILFIAICLLNRNLFPCYEFGVQFISNTGTMQ